MEKYITQYDATFTELSKKSGYFIDNYHHSLPLITVALYYVMVHYMPKLLAPKDGKPKPPSKLLKFLMASWNLFLSVISVAMVLGVAVPYTKVIQERGILGALCDTKHDLANYSPKLFWVHIIVYSKYAELIDTVFLIVKNPTRPVPFLHWYHHMTVLVFSWYAGVYKYTLGYWFGAINCFVHTIMYFYYFLTELGYRPSWAVLITIIQILQMFIGIGLNIAWASEWLKGKNCMCNNPRLLLSAAVIMYGSYLYLFVKFFIGRYFGSSKPAASKKTKTN